MSQLNLLPPTLPSSFHSLSHSILEFPKKAYLVVATAQDKTTTSAPLLSISFSLYDVTLPTTSLWQRSAPDCPLLPCLPLWFTDP